MGILSEKRGKKKAWKTTILCLFWTFCRGVNRRAFQNIEGGD